MFRSMIRWPIRLAFGCALGLLLSLPAAAQATFPGPGGKIVYVAQAVGAPGGPYQQSDLWTINPDGSGRTQLTDTPQYEYEPRWAPDGSKIVFSYPDELGLDRRDIFVMNADGTGRQNLTNTPDWDERDPAWSPDGSKIVYSRGEYFESPYALWVMNASGGAQTQLTNPGGMVDRSPKWSPDGTKIAFQRFGIDPPSPDYDDLSTEIWLVNPDGSGAASLMHDGASDRDPDWSPDSARIVFTRADNLQPFSGERLTIVQRDGTGLTPVGPNPGVIGNLGAAAWSPDGTKIVFANESFETGEVDLYLMNTDGSGVTPLTTDSLETTEYDPDWSPVGAGPPIVPPGGSVTTDTENDGATAAEPVEVSVTLGSNGGTVLINVTPTTTAPPAGFTLVGHQVELTAPSAPPPGAPLRIEFLLDSSTVVPGTAPGVGVFKNGALVPNCVSTTVPINPDPCLASSATVGDDIKLTVLSTSASTWNFGLRLNDAKPTRADQCKKGGWRTFGFRNQGQCIKYVNQLRKSARN